jgi:lipopolysaccharide export system protein LptA
MSGTQKSDKKVHLTLRSNDLDVHSRDGNLDKIVATGAVDMVQGIQNGRGTYMEYDVATGATRLMGTSAVPAEVFGGTERSLKACIIQIAADGKRTATNCANEPVKTIVPMAK